jgi:hypothetical protein
MHPKGLALSLEGSFGEGRVHRLRSRHESSVHSGIVVRVTGSHRELRSVVAHGPVSPTIELLESCWTEYSRTGDLLVCRTEDTLKRRRRIMGLLWHERLRGPMMARLIKRRATLLLLSHVYWMLPLSELPGRK